MLFQSCLETNSSGIGIAREAQCSICKVCSNLVHSIEADNSNIALEFFRGALLPPMTAVNLSHLPPEEYPPMAITPLPVGDVTIAGLINLNGRFGPEI